MKEITVLASGRGTNLAAIIESGIKVSHVITDNPDAGALNIATDAGIFWSIIQKGTQSRESWGEILISVIGSPDLIVCAGFMRILPANVCKEYEDKIINLHPSLLPAYKGSTRAIQQAYADGSTEYGASIHYVTEVVDDGEVIAQEGFQVEPDHNYTLEEIEARVHELEHRLLPETINDILYEYTTRSSGFY